MVVLSCSNGESKVNAAGSVVEIATDTLHSIRSLYCAIAEKKPRDAEFLKRMLMDQNLMDAVLTADDEQANEKVKSLQEKKMHEPADAKRDAYGTFSKLFRMLMG